MLIREMEIKDIDKVMNIERTLFSSPWKRSDFIYEINENPFSYNYVLEDSELIGFLCLMILDHIEINNIAIDKRYQRQGYGQLLMKYAINKAKAIHGISMSLEVRASNAQAIRLYERNGFEIKAIRKDYYQDNYEDAYLMVREVK